MSWRCVHPSAEDPYVHVVPEDDEKQHVLRAGTCWCRPRVDTHDDRTGRAYRSPLVVHRAADCREVVEEAERILRLVEGTT